MTSREQLCYANGVIDGINYAVDKTNYKISKEFFEDVVRVANKILKQQEIKDWKIVKHDTISNRLTIVNNF